MNMADNDYIESEEFPGRWVRVRGRIAREEGQVRWSPCLRTEKGPRERPMDAASRPEAIPSDIGGAQTSAAVVPDDTYAVAFLDYRDATLVQARVAPDFLARNQGWATFVTRLPYHPQTQAIVLRIGERELGRLDVPTDRPYFTLLHPNEDDYIDPTGFLHLHWAGHDSAHPMTFFVRYSHNGRDWLRPGVNLVQNDYYLDLREMPGGKRCVVEAIATNGYRTSYARTRHFEVPEKPPELFVGETDGPILFAQGFLREDGPITGEGIAWRADGEIVSRGGTLDVRALPAGIHEISVGVTNPAGGERVEFVGSYDANTGARVGRDAGL